MTDLVGSVLASADARPDAPAVSSGRRTLSYGDVAARIRAVADGLREQGLQPGDRVLFSVRPGPDAVVLALGVVAAGGCVVFGDPGAGAELFRSRLRLAQPRWVAAESVLYLASSRPLRSLARRRGLDLPPYAQLVPDARHIVAGPSLPGTPRGALRLSILGGQRLERPGESAGPAERAQPADGDAEALVVFTSGTTEAPKAVVHSRASLGASLGDAAVGFGVRPGHRVLSDQLMVGIPALIAGAHWTLPAPGGNPGARPEQYLRLLRDAELLFLVPAHLDAILRTLDARPELAPRALDTLVLGGAPVLAPLLHRARERFPDAAIRAVYGMTEILPVAIADGVEKLERDAAGDWAGRLVPSVRARIDDGELVLAGPGLARGYLGEPPLAELRTGDLARLDGDELTLLGRAKDMFIRGTQNVYPGLYEPVIAGLPGVVDVALTGLPDGIGDDRIVLLVVPEVQPATPTADHPAARRVAAALPGLIDAAALPDVVLAVPAIPRHGRSRKPDRRAIAELAGSAA